MIVHMRNLFIVCVLDCMNSCTSDCLYEHPRSDPSSPREWEAEARRRKKTLAKAAWYRPADTVTFIPAAPKSPEPIIEI